MTQSSRAASSRKRGGAAARSEAKGKREVEVFGISLTLVSEVPATFSLDLAMVQSGGVANLGSVLNLLRGIGVTDDQIREYREKVAAGDVELGKDEDALFKLVEAVLEEFNTSVGE